MPNISIDNVAIECVPNFNFLGIHFNEHLSWKPHITHISNLITKTIGLLNRLKNILPTSIKLMIYNSLILSRINYGILAWGYNSERILKLQKKSVRLITLAKFNAHSEPIFKSLNLLILRQVDPPECTACQEIYSVRHVLIDCIDLGLIRPRFYTVPFCSGVGASTWRAKYREKRAKNVLSERAAVAKAGSAMPGWYNVVGCRLGCTSRMHKRPNRGRS